MGGRKGGRKGRRKGERKKGGRETREMEEGRLDEGRKRCVYAGDDSGREEERKGVRKGKQ